MFRDPNMFQAYTNRGKALIGLPDKQKPKYLKLLSKVKEHFPNETKDVIDRISQVDQAKVIEILDQIPNSVMGELYKEWVLRLLIYRKNG